VNRLKDLGTGHPTPPLRFTELATLHGRRLRVRRTSSGEYELKVPYSSDEGLDQTMEELLGDIASHADNRNCFSESDARMHNADRHWG
jgi:hypothetical protein